MGQIIALYTLNFHDGTYANDLSTRWWRDNHHSYASGKSEKCDFGTCRDTTCVALEKSCHLSVNFTTWVQSGVTGWISSKAGRERHCLHSQGVSPRGMVGPGHAGEPTPASKKIPKVVNAIHEKHPCESATPSLHGLSRPLHMKFLNCKIYMR